MQLTPTQMLAVAAAVAVVFWPQIWPVVQGFLNRPAPLAPSPTKPTSSVVGSEPAAWVADLFAMKAVLEANGQSEAAGLVSQAIVKVIAAPVPKPQGGQRK